MHAPVPPLRPKPVLGMKDMGMGGMDHGGMSGMDHGSMQGMDPGSGGGSMESGSMSMSHDMRDKPLVPPNVKFGVGVDMIAPLPVDRTGHKPLVPDSIPHRDLTYPQLPPLTPSPDNLH